MAVFLAKKTAKKFRRCFMAATCDERFWPASAPRPGGGPEAIDVNGWWKATCDFRSAARIVDLQRVGLKNNATEPRISAQCQMEKKVATNRPQNGAGRFWRRIVRGKVIKLKAESRGSPESARVRESAFSFLLSAFCISLPHKTGQTLAG